jgi:predicted N-formylglutamate amidohydrolase
MLIACDHASHAVPAALAWLGLTPASLTAHIGWDIGAGAVARLLAQRLDAPAILAGYSRLVIDCNRDVADPASIPEASDGIAVPGNRALLPAAREARREAIFAPYHAAIAAWIETRLARDEVPALVSIHSFTPVMAGTARPWHVGILWDEDPRIPVPLMAALRSDPALVVGDNEPYSARVPAGYTVRHHAVARALPHVAVEVRQDLIAADAGAGEWARRLAEALAPILARRDIHALRRG